MKILKNSILTLAFAALGGAFHAGAAPDVNENLAGLSGRVFLVEVTVLSSTIFPEFEGAVLNSCFTFQEDGTWLDLEWPGEGAEPLPGVWVQHTQYPHIAFTATSNAPALGWRLVEYGIVQPGRALGGDRMRTNAMVFSEDDELVFYFEGSGRSVDTCPLP